MIYAVALNHLPVLIDEQRKGDVVPFNITANLPRPLPDDTDDCGAKTRIFIQMRLQIAQLAAAIGSPCASEKG